MDLLYELVFWIFKSLNFYWVFSIVYVKVVLGSLYFQSYWSFLVQINYHDSAYCQYIVYAFWKFKAASIKLRNTFFIHLQLPIQLSPGFTLQIQTQLPCQVILKHPMLEQVILIQIMIWELLKSTEHLQVNSKLIVNY